MLALKVCYEAVITSNPHAQEGETWTLEGRPFSHWPKGEMNSLGQEAEFQTTATQDKHSRPLEVKSKLHMPSREAAANPQD